MHLAAFVVTVYLNLGVENPRDVYVYPCFMMNHPRNQRF